VEKVFSQDVKIQDFLGTCLLKGKSAKELAFSKEAFPLNSKSISVYAASFKENRIKFLYTLLSGKAWGTMRSFASFLLNEKKSKILLHTFLSGKA